MTEDVNRSPEYLPVPGPPEGGPPPPSWLQSLLKHRFFLIVLIILIFFVALFVHGYFRKDKNLATSQLTPAPEVLQKAEKPGEPVHGLPAPVRRGEGPAGEVTGEAPAAEAPVRPPEAAPPAPGEHAPAPLQPPPPPAVPKAAVKGSAFTHALAGIIDDQVNNRLFGWRPNTIIFGKSGLTDNVNNLQLGVLEVARRTIVVLNENMTRFAITEAYNPRVNEAMNFLMVSPDKYWFPSASGKYREAIADLRQYSDDLASGRARFYSRVDNLIALLANYKDILGSSYHNLVKDVEADGSPVSYFRCDDYFYFSKGVAIGMTHMLEAVREDFDQELARKNTHKLLEDAIHALHEASQLSPWLVTNGAKDGILANHRANMSTYIGEAEHVVAIMQTVLATN
ncbi:MAG: DUF2333 family protein [Deltaproteobacteria bacterium]|nr:DUF2333 family protein [Deltaproteobacteria bacterium]